MCFCFRRLAGVVPGMERCRARPAGWSRTVDRLDGRLRRGRSQRGYSCDSCLGSGALRLVDGRPGRVDGSGEDTAGRTRRVRQLARRSADSTRVELGTRRAQTRNLGAFRTLSAPRGREQDLSRQTWRVCRRLLPWRTRLLSSAPSRLARYTSDRARGDLPVAVAHIALAGVSRPSNIGVRLASAPACLRSGPGQVSAGWRGPRRTRHRCSPSHASERDGYSGWQLASYAS